MKFYQIHVHKTGGTSLIVYAGKHNIDWFSGGHEPFIERSIPKSSIVITALRCPIKRIISTYAGGGGGGQTFSDWIRDGLITHSQSCAATYVHFFGTGPNDFDGAVSNIKSINHVLDTSHLTQQFNEKIAARYKLPPFDIHANKSFTFDISKDDIDYIKKYREMDFEICKIFGIQISN